MYQSQTPCFVHISVTYIEWPQDENATPKKVDKFWKRIELSMPKKKSRTQESSDNTSGGGQRYTPMSTRPNTHVSTGVEMTQQIGKSKPGFTSQTSGVYNTINEKDMLGPDEVYDTIPVDEKELDNKLSTLSNTDETNNRKNVGKYDGYLIPKSMALNESEYTDVVEKDPEIDNGPRHILEVEVEV